MCTLSWWRTGENYGVWFNRDESIKRAEASIPSQFVEDPVTYVSPIDPEGGGTWIWGNSHGVIGCLLNNYKVACDHPSYPVSRGVLLKSLTGSETASHLLAQLEASDLEHHKGFYLFVIDQYEHYLATWNHKNLTFSDMDVIKNPISSSGYLPDEIVSYRRTLFKKMFASDPFPSRRELFRFHSHHDYDHPAHSVLMRRSDARTVSISQVRVDRDTVTFAYYPIPEQDIAFSPVTVEVAREY